MERAIAFMSIGMHVSCHWISFASNRRGYGCDRQLYCVAVSAINRHRVDAFNSKNALRGKYFNRTTHWFTSFSMRSLSNNNQNDEYVRTPGNELGMPYFASEHFQSIKSIIFSLFWCSFVSNGRWMDLSRSDVFRKMYSVVQPLKATRKAYANASHRQWQTQTENYFFLLANSPLFFFIHNSYFQFGCGFYRPIYEALVKHGIFFLSILSPLSIAILTRFGTFFI